MTSTEGIKKTTLELNPGDRVSLGGGQVVRTVALVKDSGYVNRHDRPIYSVLWREGSTPEWSGGNSGTGDYLWTVVEEVSV